MVVALSARGEPKEIIVHDVIKEYYGRRLKSSADLRTNACCDVEVVPEYLAPILTRLHPEVVEKYYGCGLVAPQALEGLRILDLGCGAGRDCYLLSALVGESGAVIGVDMTEEQLDVARRHIEHHARNFEFSRPNVEFLRGYLEQLDELPLEAESFDVIVSNCVLNLSPDKPAILRHAYRLLTAGGEFYFSDVYSDRRLPEELQADPVLYGECLAGALYWRDFLEMARGAGFPDPRLVTSRPLAINSRDILAKLGGARFFSATYRLFKMEGLEAACEDYGQAVRYRGSVPHHPHEFVLDGHHRMETGRVFPVCRNTYRMIERSRLAPHFELLGEETTHFGIFPGCGTTIPFDDGDSGASAARACC